MAIVMISSLYQSGREELAQALARKTNWPVVSREDLVDQARAALLQSEASRIEVRRRQQEVDTLRARIEGEVPHARAAAGAVEGRGEAVLLVLPGRRW